MNYDKLKLCNGMKSLALYKFMEMIKTLWQRNLCELSINWLNENGKGKHFLKNISNFTKILMSLE